MNLKETMDVLAEEFHFHPFTIEGWQKAACMLATKFQEANDRLAIVQKECDKRGDFIVRTSGRLL